MLGLLTAIGPFAIDMYLPALPAIGAGLRVASREVQATLVAFTMALGCGQLLAGPLSDLYGRKRPLHAGLALFIAASVGCCFAPTAGALIALRFLQGLGACAAMVTPRAVVRDLHVGPDAARLMSLLLTVYSVSPILAPLAGSVVAEVAGWRSIFGVLALLGLLGLALSIAFLPETRPLAARGRGSVAGALAGYRTLLRDRRFLGLACIASLAVASFFVYVANSSFVMSAHFGVSPRSYALLFALNAVAFVAVSQANGWLARRFGLARSIRVAAIGHAIATVMLLALVLAGVDRLWVMTGFLLVAYGLNAVLVPSSFVLAMEGHAEFAGTSSALIGTLNFAGGALAAALVAPFADGAPLPMLAGIAACSTAMAAVALRTLRGPPRQLPSF